MCPCTGQKLEDFEWTVPGIAAKMELMIHPKYWLLGDGKPVPAYQQYVKTGLTFYMLFYILQVLSVSQFTHGRNASRRALVTDPEGSRRGLCKERTHGRSYAQLSLIDQEVLADAVDADRLGAATRLLRAPGAQSSVPRPLIELAPREAALQGWYVRASLLPIFNCTAVLGADLAHTRRRAWAHTGPDDGRECALEQRFARHFDDQLFDVGFTLVRIHHLWRADAR